MATTTRKNKSKSHHRAGASRRRPTHKNTGRRHHRRNPGGLGNITGLVTSAVFTVAGAVGTKYVTQMILQSSNTGIMGYLGNLVSAFVLSWGVKAFMRNDAAAAAVLAGGMVQIVLRLIADYTPFGQYTSQLGIGDYLAQPFVTPQRISYNPRNPHNAALLTQGNTALIGGMAGCGSGSLYSGKGLYAA